MWWTQISSFLTNSATVRIVIAIIAILLLILIKDCEGKVNSVQTFKEASNKITEIRKEVMNEAVKEANKSMQQEQQNKQSNTNEELRKELQDERDL